MARSDPFLILLTRVIRMFSFGAVATVLFLHLQLLGLNANEIGFLFSGTVFGDLLMTIPLTTRADKWGRKRVLMFSAALKIFSGIMFSVTSNRFLLLIAGIIGVLTPTGGEVGPFMAVEQAALTAETKDDPALITRLYSIYNFAGYFAQAAGALVAGYIVARAPSPTEGYFMIFNLFTLAAVVKVVLYSFLSQGIEAVPELPIPKAPTDAIALQPIKPSTTTTETGNKDGDKSSAKVEQGEAEGSTADVEEGKGLLAPAGAVVRTEPYETEVSPLIKRALAITGLKHARSLRIVFIISLLFIIDAFAGGLVMQTVIVGWFQKRYDINAETIGRLVSGMNILAGLSALLVIPLSRFGPLNVAVFSHLPSNVMLMAVPFMPNFEGSAGMILARSTLSQMDVPARQAFVATSVAAEERSAAGGITMIIRSVGVILAPILWGPMMSADKESLYFTMPFVVAGAMKIVYDLMLFFCFRSLKPSTSA